MTDVLRSPREVIQGQVEKAANTNGHGKEGGRIKPVVVPAKIATAEAGGAECEACVYALQGAGRG